MCVENVFCGMCGECVLWRVCREGAGELSLQENIYLLKQTIDLNILKSELCVILHTNLSSWLTFEIFYQLNQEIDLMGTDLTFVRPQGMYVHTFYVSICRCVRVYIWRCVCIRRCVFVYIYM